MSGYTKGPWHWYGDKGLEANDRTVLVGDCGTSSCGRTHLYIGPDDAALIAAAPELYEALKACHLQMLQSNNQTEYAQEANEMAIAAIAKAEGK